MFHQVSSEKKLKAYLKNFFHSLNIDVQRAYTWKKRLPRIYRLLVYPLVTRHLKNWGIRFALVDAICCVSTNPADNTSEARVS
jgi:hypothetical protein